MQHAFLPLLFSIVLHHRLTCVVQCAVGPPGPPGDTGDTGPNGDMGFQAYNSNIGANGGTGAMGNRGAYGAVGDTGASGKIGGTGQTGPTGTRGKSGAMGYTGVTGPPGRFRIVRQTDCLPGPKGPTGATGATGAIGAPGMIGMPGATGATGQTGPRGPYGARGHQGVPGMTGPTGWTGETGRTGATGATGRPGSAAVLPLQRSVRRRRQANLCPAGPKGDKGPTGPQGPQGPLGERGSIGANGAFGMPGSNGEQGYTGPEGSGAIGPVGINGYTGATGAIGFTGPAGSDIVWKCATKSIELAFIVDASSKQPYNDSAWTSIQTFVNSVISNFSISPLAVRIAFISYSADSALSVFVLNDFSNLEIINQSVSSATCGSASYSNLTSALLLLQNKIFSAIITRPNASRVAVIVTDKLNVSSPLTSTAIAVKSVGIRLVAIGIKALNQVDFDALKQITTNNAALEVASYWQPLLDARSATIQLICEDLKTVVVPEGSNSTVSDSTSTNTSITASTLTTTTSSWMSAGYSDISSLTVVLVTVTIGSFLGNADFYVSIDI